MVNEETIKMECFAEYFNSAISVIEGIYHKKVDGKRTPLTDDELNEAELHWRNIKEIEVAKVVRKDRDAEIAKSDWVVVKHNELGTPIPQEWLDYRQALRDITEQSGFPDNVEWPLSPTEQSDGEIQ